MLMRQQSALDQRLETRETRAESALQRGLKVSFPLTCVIANEPVFPHTCGRFEPLKPFAIRGISHEHSYHSDSL